MEPATKRVRLSGDDVRSRGWVFTLFSEDEAAWEGISAMPIPFPDSTWCIAQLERAPDTGRLHLQGAVYYASPQRMARLKKDFGSTVHVEKMKGTPAQAKAYCSKAETRVSGPWEFGQCPHQGKRTDWDTVRDKALAGESRNQILLAAPHLAPCVRGIDALISATTKPVPLERDIRVFYLYGGSDLGKTHRARHRFPDAFVITGKYFEGKSFDQYERQDVLILDEWDPYEWPLTLMNGLLDKWRCPLQCRYANKEAAWTTVVICTNATPDECYASIPARRGTFIRRLKYVYEILSREDPEVDFEQGLLPINNDVVFDG